jgi:hypothetical protein
MVGSGLMDKRWRNLGILLAVAVIAIFVFVVILGGKIQLPFASLADSKYAELVSLAGKNNVDWEIFVSEPLVAYDDTSNFRISKASLTRFRSDLAEFDGTLAKDISSEDINLLHRLVNVAIGKIDVYFGYADLVDGFDSASFMADESSFCGNLGMVAEKAGDIQSVAVSYLELEKLDWEYQNDVLNSWHNYSLVDLAFDDHAEYLALIADRIESSYGLCVGGTV